MAKGSRINPPDAQPSRRPSLSTGARNLKKRLGELLIEAGVIDATQLHVALAHQRRWGGKLGQVLQDLKLASEGQVLSILSRKLECDVADVAQIQRTPALDAALALVPRELAERDAVLPIAADASTLTVAMADPLNMSVVDELSFRAGRRLRVAIAGERAIAEAIARLYATPSTPFDPIAFDEASDIPVETTRDPFAALPDDVRARYFSPRPADPSASLPLGRIQGLGPASPDPAPAGEDLDDFEDLEVPPDLEVGPAFPTGPGARDEPDRERVLDALDDLAQGRDSELLTPGQLAAALARLLLQRGLLTEAELVAELLRGG